MSDLIQTLGQTMAPPGTIPGQRPPDVWGTSPIVPQQPPMQAPPGSTPGILPMSPDTGPAASSSADASPGGFGGILQGIGKIAGNPLTLAALQGYARALSMPRGMGPITRAATGLATGLEDYYVAEPYRQAQMKKIGMETEKEQAETGKAQQQAKEAKKKEAVLEGMSADDQAAALYPGVARMKGEEQKIQAKQTAAQALVPYYQSQAQALAKTNPPMSAVYQQAADAIAVGADPKDVAASVRVGQQGEHNKAIEGLQQQRVGIEQQNAATSAAGEGIRAQELKVAQDREKREAGQAKVNQDIAYANLYHRDVADITKIRNQAEKEVAANEAKRNIIARGWEKTMGETAGAHQAAVEARFQELMGGLPAAPQPGQPKPTAPVVPPGSVKIQETGEVLNHEQFLQWLQSDPSHSKLTVVPMQ